MAVALVTRTSLRGLRAAQFFSASRSFLSRFGWGILGQNHP
jgi:hypothetical protein